MNYKIMYKVKEYILFEFVGIIFVFFQITGYLLEKYGKMEWNFTNTSMVVLGIFLGSIVLTVLFIKGIRLLTRYKKVLGTSKIEKNRWRQYLWIEWIFNFVCWGALLLVYYPGICSYDFFTQITQGILQQYTSHHPLVHTLLIRKFWVLGTYVLHDANKGIFLLCLLQIIFLDTVYVYGGYLLLKNSGNKILFLGMMLFQGLFPLNAFMTCSVTKDTIFSGFMLLLFLCLLDIMVFSQRIITKKKWLLLVFSSIGTILFRNNGKYAVYVVIAITTLMIFFLKNNKAKILIALMIVCCIFSSVFVSKLEEYYDCKPGDLREMFSVPIQQFARVYITQKEKLTEEELLFITEYIDKEALTKYTVYIADPVKDGTNTQFIMHNKGSFVTMYLRLFCKHPSEYLDAFLQLNAGYIYLLDESCAWVNESMDGSGYGYIQTGANENFLNSVGIEIKPVNVELYQQIQKWVSENAYLKNPILRLLMSPGIWLYIGLYGLCIALKNKDYGFLPAFALIGGLYITLFLGPTVQMRYIFPIIICEFYFLIFGLHYIGKGVDWENKACRDA